MDFRRRGLTSVFLVALVLPAVSAVISATGPGTVIGSPSSGITPVPPGARPAEPRTAAALDALNSLRGYFIENRGQVAGPVRYYAPGNPSVAFRDDGVMFLIRDERGGDTGARGPAESPPSFSPPSTNPRGEGAAYAYLIRFDTARATPPVGRGELPFKSNFLLGNDPSQWRVDVPNFREVTYPELFPGIDLAFQMSPDGLKYEFDVRPGSDAAAIRMTYEGAGSLEVGATGLAISTPLGPVRDSAPIAYQDGGAPVGCRFALRDRRSVGFDCEGRDPSKALTIDPLVYSTLLGGSDNAFFLTTLDRFGRPENQTCGQGDRGVSIDVDPARNAYVYGTTCSTDFPVTPGAFNTTYLEGSSTRIGDAQQTFVAKLNPSGSALVYATYLGGFQAAGGGVVGGGYDDASAIAVDADGNAYLTGTTHASDYPTTPGAFDRSFTCCWPEAFVTKLNPQGNGLVYSTFLGGRGYETAWSLAIDAAGSAYVAGETNSTDLPTTPGAFDRTFNSNYGRLGDYPDVFVTKLNPTGSGLVYSTYVGGAGWEWPYALAVDPGGNAYVTGDTNSTNFPVTPGAYNTTIHPGIDDFVLKVNAAGSALGYATYLGGGSWENSFGIAVDSAGAAYVTGETNSTDFPVTAGAFQRYLSGGRDAFVTKFDPSGARLVYSTFLGGNSYIDTGRAIALDSLGNAFVTGYTYSGDFPITPDAYDTFLSGREGFISEFNAAGSGLVYSTWIGGSGNDDQGSSIRVDAFGIVYVTGWTNSSDFPTTPDAFDRTLAGKADAFVVKLLPATAADPPDLAITPVDIAFSPPPPARLGTSVTITATVYNVGGTNASNVLVRFYDGPPGGSNQVGGDQIIPSIDRFFGDGRASVPWTASPLGAHDIWVVVDPANAIPERREDNNRADTVIQVLPLEPDLTISSSDIVLVPAPPYDVGTSVQITATIRNVGGAPSVATAARFEDRAPPVLQIGTNQPVPSLPVGGSAQASVAWAAIRVGPHTLCAIADPGGVVAEMNESNNVACVSAKVLIPPDLEPTRVVVVPLSPLTYAATATVNVTVVNWGESSTGAFDVLLFDDANANARPDAGENASRVRAAGLAGWAGEWVDLPWTASPAGAHSLCAYVDPPPGSVGEYNEANNVRCAAVTVLSPPPTLPDYVPIAPQPSWAIRVGLRTPVVLSIEVRNQGNATAAANATVGFRVASAPPFARFELPPIPPGADSSPFGATWTSPSTPGTYLVVADVDIDHVVPEWNETNNQYAWTIEVLGGPMTSLVVGSPSYTDGATYVTSATPLSLSVFDQSGTGIRRTAYRVDNGTWEDYGATGPFALAGDGEHFVEWYSEDNANNTEQPGSRVLRVDDTPPAMSVSVGVPRYEAGSLFVTSATTITLASADQGRTPVGLAGVAYSIDAGPWTSYAAPVSLTGADGAHALAYRATDLLGNAANGTFPVVLDNTPPTTAISPAFGPWTQDARFALAATDGGSGVGEVEYRVDGGDWTPYVDAFSTPPGSHVIGYRSTDHLGNREAERTLSVVVGAEGNWKPLVAAVFTAILALAGALAARRRPWKEGRDRMAVLVSFGITSLPFVALEGATGIVSLFTGLLSIPPLLGLGTAVDLAILAAGISLAVVRVRGGMPRTGPNQNEG